MEAFDRNVLEADATPNLVWCNDAKEKAVTVARELMPRLVAIVATQANKAILAKLLLGVTNSIPEMKFSNRKTMSQN